MLEKSTYDTNCWLLESESLTIVHPDFSSGYVVDNSSLFHRTKEIECNQMNMYEHVVSESETQYNLIELNIYGSSRLGTFTEKVNMLSESTQNFSLENNSIEINGTSKLVKNITNTVKSIHKKLKSVADSDKYINASIGLTLLGLKAENDVKSLTKKIKSKEIILKSVIKTPIAPIKKEILSLKIQRLGPNALSKAFGFAGKVLGVGGAVVSIDAIKNPTAKNITKAVLESGFVLVTRFFPVTAAVYGIASGIGSLFGVW